MPRPVLRCALMKAVAASLVAVVLFAGTAPAFASTLSEKRAQAKAVQAEIAALDDKTEIAAEQYNAARIRHDAATGRVSTVKARLREARRETAASQRALATQADAMYRADDSFGVVAALLSAESIEQFTSTIELIRRIGEQNAATIDNLKTLEAEAAAQERRLVVAEQEAAGELAVMATNERSVKAQLIERNAVLAALSSDIKKIIARERAAEAAAARAQYENSGGSYDPGGDPPTSSRGARAVWYAKSRLGLPYVWGAAGPSSFDCSGLTMWAYAQVGVSLPHYSGAQINVGSRVSRANLQPGDLVFFGTPIHHCGMYIGGGSFIEAPHAGAVVRIASLGGRSDYVGAARP